MARRMTVLGWNDIQSLVLICSHSFPKEGRIYEVLDASRQDLVEAVLGYLQVWQPGSPMDDSARIPLVSALEAFSAHLVEAASLTSTMDAESVASYESLRAECMRIRNLLRSVMGLPDDGAGQSGSVPEGI